MISSALLNVSRELVPYFLTAALAVGTYLNKREKVSVSFIIIPILITHTFISQTLFEINVYGQRIEIFWNTWFAATLSFVRYILSATLLFVNSKSHLYKRFILWSVLIVMVLEALLAIVSQEDSQYKPGGIPRDPINGWLGLTFGDYFLSVFSAIYIFKLSGSDQIDVPLTKISMFWVAFALLFVSSTSIFLNIYSFYIKMSFFDKTPETGSLDLIMTMFRFLHIERIKVVFYALYNVIFIKALLCRK